MTPEGAIKKAICQYLERCQDIFFWVQESQGTFDTRRKIFRKKNSKYQRNGVPDINVFLKYGKIVFYVGLEVKSETGKQTKSQIDFESDFKEFGGFYFIVRSPEDAQKAVNAARLHIRSLLTL